MIMATTVTIEKLGLALGITAKEVKELTRAGVIPQLAKGGQYDFIPALQAYVQHLRDGPRSRAAMPSPPLPNARHEKFCQEVAKGASATTAYKRAGYKGGRQHAARMMTFGLIAARIAELKSIAAAECEITLKVLIDRASEIERAATREGEYMAAIRSIETLAKLANLWPAERPKVESLFTTEQLVARHQARMAAQQP
jgi:hypothetical protein